MAEAYFTVLIFVIVGVGFAAVALIAAAVLRPYVADPLKRTTYECGMDAIGSTEIKTNIRFYLFALLFVIFDVEALYVYPWAVTAKALGPTALAEMAVFLAILLAGLAYAWGKGALVWE
jgi:NADH-quinone oxidoreductase subunit A